MVSYLDLILLIPIGWAIWRGWKNGFILEVFSTLSVFVGLYLAIHFSNWLSEFLREKMDVQSEYLPVTSFLIILIGVVIGLYFLGKAITSSVKAGGGETANNVGGAFFSLSKFLLVMSVLFIFFNMLDARYSILPREQKEKSYFYEPIYNFSLFLLPAMEESSFYKTLCEKEMAPVAIDPGEPSQKE